MLLNSIIQTKKSRMKHLNTGKFLSILSLFVCLLVLKSQGQTNLNGTYTDTGYFFHPSNPRAIKQLKVLKKVDTRTYQMAFGDWLPTDYSFQFQVDSNFNLVNWTPLYSTPASPYSGFMSLDNPGNTSFSVTPLPGQAPYLKTTFNNRYDTATKTFYLHYGYQINSSGDSGQNGFDRQVYEKLQVPPVKPSPTITSFYPKTAKTSTSDTIWGTNLNYLPSVKFGGTEAASFKVLNDSTVVAVVGAGATGSVSVTTLSGNDSLAGFTFIAVAPTITSFSPSSAGTSGYVFVYGTGLSGVTSVSFGGVPASSFYIGSDTYLYAYVGKGASGNVSVTTLGGTATMAGFTFLATPKITSFSPTSAATGTTVTISGSGFTSVNYVYFGSYSASSFRVINDSTITAIVGTGATGSIMVYNSSSYGILSGFTYIAPVPTITSFSPTSAGNGGYVRIYGTGLNGATSVTFGGVAATSYYSNTAGTTLYAYVGSGATGSVSVTTTGGTATLAGFTYLPSPILNSFSPDSAATGTTVTIKGSNFTNATAVYFGGTSASGYIVVNDSTITATVGTGTSGVIRVTSSAGYGTLGGFTYIAPVPVITSFSPTSAGTGSYVYVYGTGLTGATNVTFGGVSATSFYAYNDTYLYAYVGNGASGSVSVTTSGGTATLAGFTYLAPPTITSFSPASATKGATVTIKGTGFTNAYYVYFGGNYASSYSVLNDSTISAIVGTGSTGSVSVRTNAGTGTLGGFTYIAPVPVITSFSPTSAGTGSYVYIYGTGLTGATNVTFGGVSATSFYVNSDTYLYAYVGNGASGSISVTTAGGTATLAGFTYLAAPVIKSFSPASATKGTTVTIKGTGFTNAYYVYFGGTYAASYSVLNDSTISAIVGTGSTGSISVNTNGGTGTLGGFTYIAPVPVITSFSPTSTGSGGYVYVYGTGFTGATNVSFGGVSATNFYVYSDTYLYAYVGSGASGNVSVTTPGGTGTLAGFTYIAAATVKSFSPTTASKGTIVTITGSGFLYASSVSFGGTSATNFTIVDDSTITAIVGTGTSGSVSVVNKGGTGTLYGFTYKAPVPVITSFTPVAAGNGNTVYIYGTGLTGATAVSFGGVPATNFYVYSDTYMYAYVGSGASGNVSVTTTGGTAVLAGFTYIYAPVITSFYPKTATKGDTITIVGSGFNNATYVYFGGTYAGSYNVIDDSTIKAVVGAGTTGSVSVRTSAGTGTLGGFTYLAPQPKITSISPTSATSGGYVYIYGTGLTGTTSVTFGGVPASSFYVYSDTYMYAYVGNGATGSVTVTTSGGSASIKGFIYATAPNATSFYPTSATRGDTVLIYGTSFSGTTTVSFGGTYATSFVVVDDKTIKAVVGNGTSGSVYVSNPAGSSTLAGFVYTTPRPTITSISPTSATSGSYVYIYGYGFTGATAVSFGGVAATSFYVYSDTYMYAYVGSGASGTVSVVTPNGIASLDGFVYAVKPTLTSYYPTSATKGDTVTIVGKGLSGATYVYFGGTYAASYNVVDDSTIKAVVASGSTGNVLVYNPAGSAYLSGFKYKVPVPVISSFSPTSAASGSYVYIYGTGLTNTTSVSFGGVKASSYYVMNDTSLYAYVGNGATGSVSITTAGGSASLKGFKYIGAPTITSFTPTAGINGSNVTIIGHGFTGATSVSFGLVSATSYVVLNDSTIKAIVGSGAAGTVRVTTIYGAATLAGFSYCNPSLVTITQSACGSYFWHKKTYTLSGTYTFDTLSSGGCDSLTTLKLTINKPSTDTITKTSCDSYTWHGKTYTKGGVYTFDTLNAVGCDSLTTLILKLGYATVDTITVSAVDSFSWHKTIYKKSGIYTFDTLSVFGCDSLKVLKLTITSSPLPITLANISATNKNGAIVVNWNTASELNNANFVIQHSNDGSSFTDIGIVKAIGSGANNYVFTDNTPTNGINYYRLKSIDKVGTITFSKIVSVQLSFINYQLSVTPNPAKNIVTVRGEHIISLQVIDNLGRILKTQTVQDATNPTISVSNLPAGVYHFRVQTTDGKVNSVGFVKQ